MKKLLFILLFAFPLVANAQSQPPNQTWSGLLYEFKNALRVDSVFLLPRTDTLGIRPSTLAPGAMIYRTSDKSFYGYNGVYWNKFSSGAALDSAYLSGDTLYFPTTTGGVVAVKVTGIPQGNITGLTDSLGGKIDTSDTHLYIQNNPSTTQSGSINIDGPIQAYSGFFNAGAGGSPTIYPTGFTTLGQVNDSLGVQDLQKVTDRGNITTNELITDAGGSGGRIRIRSSAPGYNMIYSYATGASAFKPLLLATGALLVSDRSGSSVTDDGSSSLQVRGTAKFSSPVKGVVATGDDELVTLGQLTDSLATIKNYNGFVANGAAPQAASYNITGNGNVQNIFTAGTRFSGNLFSLLDTVYFFGTSITLGTGSSPNTNRYSDKVSSILGNFQRNYGIGSSTMEEGTPPRPLGARSGIDTLDGIPWKVARGKIIVIEYGLNDMGCNQADYNVANFKRDYNRFLDTIYARGWNLSNVLIISPTWVPDSAYGVYSTINGGMGRPTRSRHLDYVQATEDIAQARGTMYIDMYHAMLTHGASSLISADSIHPSNTGHGYIADTISRFLKSAYFTGSNSSIYVDSTKVITNTSILLNNNNSTISNSGNNFLIANNVMAGSREIAVINPSFNYGAANYWGWHMVASDAGEMYFESVGVGSQRGRAMNFGISNPTGQSTFMKIDTTGNIGVGNVSPTSTLHLSGTFAVNHRVATSNTTADSETVLYANNSGTITISLPSASTCQGRIYIIKKISTVGNDVVIDPYSSENIDAQATKTLTLQYSSIIIQSSGANWFVLASHAADVTL